MWNQNKIDQQKDDKLFHLKRENPHPGCIIYKGTCM